MFAVIKTGGKQYRVAPGNTLEVERLQGEPGQTVTFERVLFVAQEGRFAVGAPTVPAASVAAQMMEHFRGPKQIVFKMKRRKGYHKTIGHRQDLTRIKITEIKAQAYGS